MTCLKRKKGILSESSKTLVVERSEIGWGGIKEEKSWERRKRKEDVILKIRRVMTEE